MTLDLASTLRTGAMRANDGRPELLSLGHAGAPENVVEVVSYQVSWQIISGFFNSTSYTSFRSIASSSLVTRISDWVPVALHGHAWHTICMFCLDLEGDFLFEDVMASDGWRYCVFLRLK